MGKRAKRKLNKTMRKIRFLLLVSLIIIMGILIYNRINGNYENVVDPEAYNQEIESPTIINEPEKPKDVSIKLTAIGDVALGSDPRFLFKDSNDDVFERNNKDYNYFFAGVSDIFKNDDLTIANLESALTLEEATAEKYDYGNNYWFKGNPDYANVLKAAGIETVSLANNHTYDFMQKGYDDTRDALKNVEVGYFGYEDVYETEVKGIRIGIAGFNELGPYEEGTKPEEFKAEIKEKIELLKSRNNFVITAFHWGKEYKYEFTDYQTELGRFAIDTGADLVIGHHPHVIQGLEQYNGKYIIYSLGNFCFGGNKRPPDFDTFIYQQEIVFDGDKNIKEIKEPDYIPAYISSAKGINNYQPVLAKGKEATRILQKINQFSPYKWSEETIKNKDKADLVDLREWMPELQIDMRYAGTNNITGEPVYENDDAYLRSATAKKLMAAAEALEAQGYLLKLWDGYRPSAAQQILYDKAENKSVFADPKMGSNHTRGVAVDVTLTDLSGVELEMPSDFDDMTSKANRKYAQATPEQKQNAIILEKAMKDAGFKSIPNEWWHFDDSNSKLYDLIEAR